MGQRLSQSSSPYLREAASHPIDWHPWSDEPFALARALGRPVLLDIGASWCHWCHVMDRESYSTAEIGELVNERYVAVRVDRDERPDVDARLQLEVAQLTGLSGWPLTAFLTPDGDVYFGGTYFSPRASGSNPAFRQILTWAAELYASGPEKRAAEGKRLRESVAARGALRGIAVEPAAAESKIAGVLARCLDELDRRHGGFGAEPKFLHPSVLEFCARAAAVRASARARDAVETTIRAMAAAPIFDPALGLFHRYAVDEAWREPHTEKLLGDQAAMLEATAAAARLGDETARHTAAAIGDAIVNVYFAAGCASSIPADEPGAERTSHWTRAELEAALDAPSFAVVLGFLGDAAPLGCDDTFLLSAPMPPEIVARRAGRSADAARAAWRDAMIQLRARRTGAARKAAGGAPIPGDVARAAAALLGHAVALDRRDWIAPAIAALDAHAVGSPVRRAGAPALLDDTAAAAIASFRAAAVTGDALRGRRAVECLRAMEASFWVVEQSAFRDRETVDPTTPAAWTLLPVESGGPCSGNALALEALTLGLAHGDAESARCGDPLARKLAGVLESRDPLAVAAAALAVDRWFEAARTTPKQ